MFGPFLLGLFIVLAPPIIIPKLKYTRRHNRFVKNIATYYRDLENRYDERVGIGALFRYNDDACIRMTLLDAWKSNKCDIIFTVTEENGKKEADFHMKYTDNNLSPAEYGTFKCLKDQNDRISKESILRAISNNEPANHYMAVSG